MSRDVAAQRPDFYFKQMPSLQQADEEAGKNGANEEERLIYAMSQMAGWKIIETFIENISKDLNNINKTAIANGAPLEEIGRNTVVINMTQEIIEKIINKVGDAIEACESKNEQ